MQPLLRSTLKLMTACSLIPLLWSCGDAEENSTPKIKNGHLVQTHDLAPKSTVSIESSGFVCSGVIISKRHVLTAAHCRPAVGGAVGFYNGAYPTGERRHITRVSLRPGVNPQTDQLTDSSGKFADIAVLELNAPIPSAYSPAELPTYGYPGNEKIGWMVGRGRHDDRDNPGAILKWLETKTYSSHTNDGHFLVNSSDSDGGDSGGPFYTLNGSTNRLIVHGVLYGKVFEWAMRGKYTSVLHHMNWILQSMNEPIDSSKTVSTRVGYWVDTNPSWPGIYYARGQGACEPGEATGHAQNCQKMVVANLKHGVAYWVDTNPSWPGVYYQKVNGGCPHGGMDGGPNCQIVRFRAAL